LLARTDMISILTVVALALVSSPAGPWLDRRSALQTAGGMVAAASLPVPMPAFAAIEAAEAQRRFDIIKAAASASLSSTSRLLDKVMDLELPPRAIEDSFLYTAPSLCEAGSNGGRQFVSVRLWQRSVSGTNGISSAELVQGFQTRFAKNEKPKGFKVYYGAVVKVNTEQFALFANIFETQEQAELINTQERAIVKKKLLRAELDTVLPVFSCDPELSAALGGCA